MSEFDSEKVIRSGTDRTATSITVVVVSYNSLELLRDCLVSLESEPWEQVVVVDNLSSDRSDEMVRREFPWANLIVTSKNDGYGAAANLAIASCSSKYILLLNSDTVVQHNALRTLQLYMDEHPQAAVVGPQLVNLDGTLQVSCFEFPTPLQILRKETRFARVIPMKSTSSVHAAQAVPWVLGAALAIRRAAFESVGGFDQSFFMYYEEVDLCYRLEQAGWQTHFVPNAVILHVGGASTKHYRAAMLQQLYKSLCQFYRRHYSRTQKFQLRLVLSYLMFRNIFKTTFRMLPGAIYEEAREYLSVWRSVVVNLWSKHGWLNDESA